MTYTADKFTGEYVEGATTYTPKGFFIDVEDGGTATLNGTISDFVTSRNKATTPRYVAPVVANGAGATFNLGTKGVIKNNVVGYIVDNSKAHQDAQSIKQYVKGAGPNVPRVPNAATQKVDASKYADRPRKKDAVMDGGAPGSGITATAGAVIYKGGAVGTIEGKITNNRGDTGGIMVSDKGTKVNISGSGTNISKNVGVQFGGGTTVEQGGTIAMSDGTIEYNVAWFGGGAVYATENGVDWLLGKMTESDGTPKFDDRVGGVFEMTGGSLQYNTAFTRGGAILADSNGVKISKGKLQNNMSRMLGGAVYVMGDHPKYTYTMNLTFVRVHDNTAVSGQYGRTQWGSNYPEKQDVDGLPASQDLGAKNNLLQRKLKAPSTDCGDAGDSIFSSELISGNSDDINDGRGTDGTGGGVWLCAYGNTVFDAGSPQKVFIDNNYATGTKGTASKWDSAPVKASFVANQKESDDSRSGRSGGSDFHSDTGDIGTVEIKNANSPHSAWVNENSGSQITDSTFTSKEILNLVNKKPLTTSTEYAVDISGNIARRGGGLAADGTFYLGIVDDRVTADAQMQLSKKWAFTADRSPVAIRIEGVNNDNKKAVIADVPLDGVANSPQSEFDTTEELDPTTDPSNGAISWNGRFKLPLQLTATDGTIIDVFRFTVDQSYVDTDPEGVTSTDVTPTTAEGSSNLAKVLTKIRNKYYDEQTGTVNQEAVNTEIKKAITIDYNNGFKFTCTELEVEYDSEAGTYVVKTDDEGNVIPKTDANGHPINDGKYVLSWSNADLNKVEFDLSTTEEKAVDPETGQETVLYSIHMLGISLGLEATNDNDAITEKYVNKDVHSNIVQFDKEFTYDVMAYVPLTATEFTISDPLVEGLEFANAKGEKTSSAQDAIQMIAIHTVNNHQTGPEGTVSSKVSENLQIKKDTVNANIDNNTISITVDKNSKTSATGVSEQNALKAARGKWVQLTFNARIKDRYRNIDALKELVSGTTKPSGETKSWEEESSIKKGDPTRVYTTGNGDLALVAQLIAKVGPDEIVWAVEGPERLFARTASGKYYATPKSDKKAGATWEVCAEDSADWKNANNRYTGTPPEAYDTVDSIDLGDSKLDALKDLPAVKRETVAEACEGPSRLFAKTSGGDYYATPMNDKSGLVWNKLEENSADWKNAKNRFDRTGYESRNTVRFFDLDSSHGSLTLDPSEMTNWPVISKMTTHEGMSNQASYSVKFGNNAEAKTYKTNTVTVKPETTELKVEKLWGADGEGSWPDEIKSVTFDIYAIPKNNEIQPVYMKDGKVVGVAGTQPEGSEKLTVTLTKDNYRATVEGLPRLKGYIYLARETKITDANDKSYNLAYSDSRINKGVVSDTTEIENMEISTSMKFSYAGNGAKFESLRDKVDKKVVRGAIADDRLWAMTLDGSYFVTNEGDTEGDKDSVWTLVEEPKSEKDDYATYDRAKELLGAIDSNGGFVSNAASSAEELDNDKIEELDEPVGTAPVVFDIENVVTAFNGALKDVEVTKKWKGAIKDDIPSAEAFKSFLVLKNGNGDDVSETYKDKLEVTARGTTYIAKWSRIPKDNYKIEEKPVPGFETVISEDGKTITNTKKPSEEKPEIEKYVNQAVHKDIKLDEVFTYDIIAYVTKDADSVKITDKLHDMLTFEGDSSDVSVVDLGEDDNHLVTNNVSGVKVNDKATVAKEGKIIDGTAVSFNDQVLTVFITNTLKKSDAVYDPVQIDNIDPSAEGYYVKDGDDYKASSDTSAQADKQYFEESYKAAENIKTGDDVSGGYYEKDGDVYKLTEDVTAENGKTYYERVFKEVTIEFINPSQKGYYEKDGETYKATTDAIADPGKQYYVKSEEETGYEYDEDEDQPVTALRGHWIKVTFKARINDKTLEEVKKAYQDISALDVDDGRDPENVGNAPVRSAENHTGIPNDASYTIGVANEAGIEEDVHVDRSNVVTVKPEEKKKEEPKEEPEDEDEVKPDDEDNNDVKDAEEKGSKKTKSANTGDETPLGYAIFGLLGSAAALELMRRRRMS